MQLDEWSTGIGKHMLKVEDGKSVTGTFRGDVIRFYQHWRGGKSMICPGRETCQLCASTIDDERKATGRFRVNFIVKDGGAPLVVKVFEGGKRVYEQIRQLNSDIPLEKAWVRISRVGTKTNTQWTIAIIPGQGGLLTSEDEKRVLGVELLDIRLIKDDSDEEEAVE